MCAWIPEGQPHWDGVSGIIPLQGQELALPFAKPHWVSVDPFVEVVRDL